MNDYNHTAQAPVFGALPTSRWMALNGRQTKPGPLIEQPSKGIFDKLFRRKS